MDILEKIDEKYGSIGMFIAILSGFVILVAWFLGSVFFLWPAIIPLVIFIYMMWSVRE